MAARSRAHSLRAILPRDAEPVQLRSDFDRCQGGVNIVRQVAGPAQEPLAFPSQIYDEQERGKLTGGRELQIIRAVGNQFVAERAFKVAVLQKEGSGHPLHVASRQAGKIAFEPGKQEAVNTFTVQVLTPFRPGQAECFVEFAIGIGEARQVVQFIRSKKFGGAFFRAKVNKRDASAATFDLRSNFRELGDRLAAKTSAEMAQEHKKKRPIRGQSLNGLASLRCVRVEQLRINSFGLKHCGPDFH